MLKSSSSEKKLVKPLKNCFFGPNLHGKGVIMDHAQDEKKFFLVGITKADHQLSESFYFIKISYVLIELWVFFYLEWCFLSKKCYFQLKHLWQLCPFLGLLWPKIPCFVVYSFFVLQSRSFSVFSMLLSIQCNSLRQ